MGFAVRVRSAGQKYGPTCHQRDRADVTEFFTLVRLSSLGQHVGVLALAGYKRRKSALTANPIVYLSWLSWRRKWRCRLTGIAWDVKEPLRTTNCLAVTTLSVPVFWKLYSIDYTCRASWRGGYMTCHFGSRLTRGRSWVRVSVAVEWPCVLGQSTLPMCTLSLPRSEWVPTWTLIACVWIVSSAVMAAGAVSSGELCWY